MSLEKYPIPARFLMAPYVFIALVEFFASRSPRRTTILNETYDVPPRIQRNLSRALYVHTLGNLFPARRTRLAYPVRYQMAWQLVTFISAVYNALEQQKQFEGLRRKTGFHCA
ncbi:hypothetical protein B0I72DRAFT_131573 [Yarrowia lipolytica]|uniref:Uncharacterized protein n=1 Tax=Yarrowia lipolytica TaxID=4952 RepID=A0A371C3Q1_YARLL|nr:hypothetical protein B0I71DRAFT_141720 [Yarrowia lipolytica]RDW29819.1 hypothetical protein B0I72DRAFT_131573 [Yarrowia lipolytica]RDW39233.1 hypothetical protein B0I73DRAFT_141195 [Yarrowia lipolytica]RDW45308.1 hypothetical protein B0I74DRAFT_129319 [Yarrowia lipolytica]RDW52765.1 hypothetical protein B0I75DRAFT_128468 [Yarrowia lipolytica]